MRLSVLLLSLFTVAACGKDGEDSAVDTSPPEEEYPGPFVQVAAASTYTCGLRENGSVECWGLPLEDVGQLVPPDDVVFTQISAGTYHACGVVEGKGAVCWGTPLLDYGQTEPPAALEYEFITVGDYHTCAIAADSVVSCWGDDSVGQVSDQTPRALQIDAGGNVTCAVTTANDGDCWGELGDDPNNYMDDGPYNPSPLSKYNVVVGGHSQFGCGSINPEIEGIGCWGRNDNGEAVPPTGVSAVTMDAGPYHTCGIDNTGTAYCWGLNDVSQSTVPAGLRFTDISVGFYHSCGITTDEQVVCWGENFQGQSDPPIDDLPDTGEE